MNDRIFRALASNSVFPPQVLHRSQRHHRCGTRSASRAQSGTTGRSRCFGRSSEKRRRARQKRNGAGAHQPHHTPLSAEGTIRGHPAPVGVSDLRDTGATVQFSGRTTRAADAHPADHGHPARDARRLRTETPDRVGCGSGCRRCPAGSIDSCHRCLAGEPCSSPGRTPGRTLKAATLAGVRCRERNAHPTATGGVPPAAPVTHTPCRPRLMN